MPDALRRALTAHAEAEAPNEACGLLLVRDGVAERYVPGRNAAASPYRFELEVDDPEVWFAEDDGYELAVFHSHLAENIGLWAGRPYLIYSVRKDDLAAFRISKDGQIEELELKP